MKLAAASIVLLACSKPAPTTPSSKAELSPALNHLAWLPGTWSGKDDVEHWIPASGAIYGINIADDKTFEVMVIDDAAGPGKPDGTVRFIAMPGGMKGVEFTEKSPGVFTLPTHDFPQSIAYARKGDALVATISGAEKTMTFDFTRSINEPAPDLVESDKAFSIDTAKRGVDAWVSWFAPGGAMMGGLERVEGEPAIREMMEAFLAEGTLAWSAIASGKRGPLGFTVGKATYTKKGESAPAFRTTYATIWQQQPDGAWKVLFDVGRRVNE